jgi:uncharacterized protein YceH (UPF0502 family)
MQIQGDHMQTDLFTDRESSAIIARLARETGSPVLSRLADAANRHQNAASAVDRKRVGLEQQHEAASAALADAECRLDAAGAEVAGLRDAIAAISTEHLAKEVAAEAGVSDEDIEYGRRAIEEYKALRASLA